MATQSDADPDSKLAGALSLIAHLCSDLRVTAKALRASEKREESSRREKLRVEEKLHKVSALNDKLQVRISCLPVLCHVKVRNRCGWCSTVICKTRPQAMTREMQAQNKAIRESSELSLAKTRKAHLESVSSIQTQIESVRGALQQAIDRNETLESERAAQKEHIERLLERDSKLSELVELQVTTHPCQHLRFPGFAFKYLICSKKLVKAPPDRPFRKRAGERILILRIPQKKVIDDEKALHQRHVEELRKELEAERQRSDHLL